MSTKLKNILSLMNLIISPIEIYLALTVLLYTLIEGLLQGGGEYQFIGFIVVGAVGAMIAVVFLPLLLLLIASFITQGMAVKSNSNKLRITSLTLVMIYNISVIIVILLTIIGGAYEYVEILNIITILYILFKVFTVIFNIVTILVIALINKPIRYT